MKYPVEDRIRLTPDEAEQIIEDLTTKCNLGGMLVITRQLVIREALGGVKAEDSSLYKRTIGE